VYKIIKKKLLAHFKSTKRIQEASDEEIISQIGSAKGKIIINHFKNKNEMRILIQRVTEASVTVDQKEKAE